ncbi:hypothetical protein GTO89_15535 [Heliobacterium gestii]|uniref:Uncharacterized protein n=1 Tax=Heliomicrobium gestii TaxID=2699 RepID=A0A845LGA0_HELGE|nr:hypothetical protein [Heliomicrobium gestii]MBM7868250.1 hypothetical protein [Heliomicrobium gestii]MZP44444.1 hypothetical protein [Heliomicrobium gestii]
MERLSEIFQALRFAFTEPLADQIHVEWMSFHLTLRDFFYISLALYFLAGAVVGFLFARYRYKSRSKTSSDPQKASVQPRPAPAREEAVKNKGELKHMLDEVSASEDRDE